MKKVCVTLIVGLLVVGAGQVLAQELAADQVLAPQPALTTNSTTAQPAPAATPTPAPVQPVKAGPALAQPPVAADARQAAQDEVVRRQEAQVAGVALINQGEQLYYQGQYDVAIAKLEEGLKILPRARVTGIDYKRGSRFLSDAYYRLGDAAYREGNMAKAKMLAEKSLNADSSNRSADSLLHKAQQTERAAVIKAQQPKPLSEEPRPDKTPEFDGQKTEIKKLFREGQILLNSGQFDEAEKRFKQIIAIDRYNDDAFALLQQVNQARQDSALTGQRAVRAQRLWEVSEAWTPAIHKESATVEKRTASDPITTSSAQTAETMRKMNEIIIPEINFRDAVIADVVNFLSQESRRLDPQKNGVNILLGAGAAAPATPAPATPVPAPDAAAAPAPAPVPAPDAGPRRITLALHNVPLLDALKYVTSLAGLKYRVEANAVLVLPLDAVEGGLITRSYPVSPGAIRTVLASPSAATAAAAAPSTGTDYRAFGSSAATTTAGTADVKALFTEAGVPFPPGSSLVYNERTSMLIVRNTPENLEVFERVLAAFNVVPSQVEVEAKFIDVSQTALDELGFNWTLGPWQFGDMDGTAGRRVFQVDNGATSNLRDSTTIKASAIDALLAGSGLGGVGNVLGSISGILTDPTFQLVIKALSQKGDTDLLSAPKITTISGQQAQIKVVQEFIYPTAFSTPQVTSSAGSLTSGGIGYTGSIPSAFKTRELGVLLNVTPTVGADGNTINLTLVPEVSEFLGFLDYSSLSAVNGLSLTNSIKQPLFASRTLTTSVIIWDGQTVVLGGLLREDLKTLNDKVPFLGDIPWVGRLFQSKSVSRSKRNLLIFVTARLIDPAGNSIHRSNQKVGM
jgi:general secretion pathway protein D